MTEYVYVVDENDNEIEKKDRDKLTRNDRWRIVSIWVEDKDGNVLLQKRNLNKRLHPGAWTAAVEGTVDYGDDYETTAKREVEEEIGLNDFFLKKGKKYIGPWGREGYRSTQGYKIIIDRETKLTRQESEVAKLKWFNKEELGELSEDNEKFPLTEEYKKLGFIS